MSAKLLKQDAANVKRRSRYRADGEYRQRSLRQAQELRERKGADPLFKQAEVLRVRISNARMAIERHEEKIEAFSQRIVEDTKKMNSIRRQMSRKAER